MIHLAALPELLTSHIEKIAFNWRRAFFQRFPDDDLNFEGAAARICRLLPRVVDEDLPPQTQTESEPLRQAIDDFVAQAADSALARKSLGLLPGAIAEACGIDDPIAVKTLRMCARFLEVTADVSVELERKRADQLLRTLFDAIQDTVVVVNKDWSILRVNRAFFKRTISAPGAIEGRNFFETFFHEFRGTERTRRSLRAAMEAQRLVTLKVAGARVDGQHEGRAFPLDGGGFILLLRRVSKRRILRTTCDRAHKIRRAIGRSMSSVGSAQHLQEALSNLADITMRYFADTCFIELIGGDGRFLYFEAATRASDKRSIVDELKRLITRRGVMPIIQPPRLIQRVTGDVLRSFARDPEMYRVLRALDPQSLISLPLVSPTRSLGQMTLIRSGVRGGYGTEELRALEQLANSAALSIENLILRDQLLRIEREQRFLSDASHALLESRSLAEALSVIEGAVVPELADACIVYGIEGDHLRALGARTRDAELTRAFQEAAAAEVLNADRYPLVFDALRRRVTLATSTGDCAIEALRVIRGPWQIGEHSMLVVPLAGRQRVIGVMVLASCSGARRLFPASVRAAEELAACAAAVLNNVLIPAE